MKRYALEFWKSVVNVRGYYLVGMLLFAAGVWIGAANESFHHVLESQLESIRGLAGNLQKSSNPTLSFIGFIFLNNALKALFVMAAGILFGFAPVFFMVINGMILGYLWTITAEKAGAGAALVHFAKGILPHGIIEISVIILACAYGLKMGSFAYRWLGLDWTGRGRESLRLEWRQFTRLLIPASAGIVILLLLAAVIESTLTRWILNA